MSLSLLGEGIYGEVPMPNGVRLILLAGNLIDLGRNGRIVRWTWMCVMLATRPTGKNNCARIQRVIECEAARYIRPTLANAFQAMLAQ